MDLAGRKVLIIGAARQGLALARFLASRGCTITVNDRRPAESFSAERQDLAGLEVEWVFGDHPLELLDDTDLVCVSGGVPLDNPLVAEARARGIPLSNDSQILLEVVPCKVVGITGSAGKSTTTVLAGRMAEVAVGAHSQNGKRFGSVWVGGNLGVPLITVVDQMAADDLAVMELSSFQLELMTRSPQIAAILNITPNHLDRHGTMEAYTAAKARILDFQGADDLAVLGRDDPGAWALSGLVKGELRSFGLEELGASQQGSFVRDEQIWLRDERGEQLVMPRGEVRLRGEHNLQNVLAACAIASAAGLPVDAMREAVESFTGVPHRLEWVRKWKGAEWYNDSIATAPERSIAAIRSFEAPLVLLAGGRDKDLPWQDFASLVRRRVDHLILFGEAADLIHRAVGETQDGQRPFSLVQCPDLRSAVQAAAEVVEPGDVVLLSPGGTSFDEFIDFEERGERFKEMVMAL